MGRRWMSENRLVSSKESMHTRGAQSHAQSLSLALLDLKATARLARRQSGQGFDSPRLRGDFQWPRNSGKLRPIPK
jgi:hypothetical protein